MSFYGKFYAPRRKVALGKFGDGRTVQADAEKVSITSIVARARKRGGIVNAPVRQGQYADVSGDAATVFLESLNFVARAQSLFDQLPAKVRDRFHNDARSMLAFIDDPENKEEAIKLGLIKKPEAPPAPPEPMAVRVVSDERAAEPVSPK